MLSALSPVSTSRLLAGGALPPSPPHSLAPSPPGIRRAAEQFEAIILRQLLAPALDSMAGGSLSGNSGPAGGAVYGYLLTDVLAQAMSQGGGFGFADIIEHQLSPKNPPPAAGKPQKHSQP
ncbi:Rod binding protein [Opitutaceae bacterium TAV1]|nr:Rod binding protein [Opitutaceae bacterium TAV1]